MTSVGESGVNNVIVISNAVAASVAMTPPATPMCCPSQLQVALPNAPPMKTNASAKPTVADVPPRPSIKNGRKQVAHAGRGIERTNYRQQAKANAASADRNLFRLANAGGGRLRPQKHEPKCGDQSE